MATSSLLAIGLSIAGATSFLVLGLAFLMAGRRRSPAIRAAATLSLLGAASFTIIGLENFGLVQGSLGLEAVEMVLTLAGGPALFVLIAALIRSEISWFAIALPAIAIGLLVLLAFAARLPGADIRAAAWTQIAYTAAAATLLLRERRRRNTRLRVAAAVVVVVSVIHLAQITRMVSPRSTETLVPAAAGLAAFLALFFLARGVARSPLFRPPATTSQVGLEHLVDALRTARAFARQDYRLSHLALAVGLTDSETSALINKETGEGFVRFLNRERLRAARELLCDPAERDTSIEAIALLVGFKSRSAFYRAFTQEVGQSPGDFRKQASVS